MLPQPIRILMETRGGSIKAPKGVVMHGTSAEWILAGKNPGDNAPLFPNYGATVFFHGLAHRKDGVMESINDAIIVSAQDVTSAAVKDTDGVIVHSAALF
ncbi:hypothetical protein QBC46DRAFT_346022 [Diplogelasinospora grovesii]|uniref:Uncharacterized protein n=1 Tax=Diplogelasinospora grovesii TaxID=303347 RepID=A0AAN6S0Z9_9PEZI|nr:hypothetical protein QBC46DRAFT_346022 [Diplogelasinospora grovesii]